MIRTGACAAILIFGCLSVWTPAWGDTAPGETNQEAVAKVNGTPITWEELEKNTRFVERRYESAKISLPGGEENDIKRVVLDKLIDEILILEVAQNKEIRVPEGEVDDAVQRIKLAYRDNEKFEQELKRRGRSLEELKDSIRKSRQVESVLKSVVAVEPEDLEKGARRYYESHPEEFVVEESRRVSHILIRAENKQDEEARKKAKHKAEALLKPLESGEDFARLAAAESEAPDAKAGGDLGYLIPGRMVPELDEVIFSLEKGILSGVVESRFGFHIVRVTDVSPKVKLSFDQVKAGVMRQVKEQTEQEKRREYIASLRKGANIEIFLK